MKKTRIKSKDIYIYGAAAILFAVAVLCFSGLLNPKGSFCVVKVNGVQRAQYPLEKDGSYTVTGYRGTQLTFSVKDGSVKMENSDCPDKICMAHRPISRAGECIVCLPNRVVLEIAGSEEDGQPALDGIAGK